MPKKRGAGFQKPIDTGQRREVRLARVATGEDGVLRCSCGQPFKQRRDKVREDAAQRHVEAKHDGRAFWL